MKYLDKIGLTYLWSKLKPLINKAGNEVFIGDEEDAPEDTKLIIDDEGQPLFNSEVVNSLEGNETAKAPSVKAVNDRFTYSTTETVCGTYLGKPLYRRYITATGDTGFSYDTGVSIEALVNIYGYCKISGQTFTRPFPLLITGARLYCSYYDNGVIYFEGDRTSNTVYLTIEYTKTTD